MVFSADMLLSENYNEPTMIDTTSIGESYFQMGLKYINEMTNDFSNINKEFYKSILEAGENTEIVHEAFSDFASKIKEIINKFLNFLKSIWNKFIINMNKLVKSDKYIKNHKKDFIDFAANHEFSARVYKYTLLDDDTFPQVTAYSSYANTYKNYTITPDTGVTMNAEVLLGKLSTAYSSLIEDNADWYEAFRGEVLGDNKSYTAKEYEQELFEKFRDGSSSPSKEIIDSGWVQEALDRFLGYDKRLKAVEDLKKKLEKEYKQIKDSIKELDIYEFEDTNSLFKNIFKDFDANSSAISSLNLSKDAETKDKLNKDIRLKMDNINKVRMNRIEGMCNIHALAFTKKLDAMKEAYKQDKKILYTALNKIHPISTKHESVIESSYEMDRLYEAYSYANILIDEAYNQNDIVNYIGECIALEAGDLSPIRYINESAIDVIKDVIKKIIEAIKSMFGKFSTKLSGLFTTDKTFLDKYKDVILKKPFKDKDLTMYNYNIGRLDDYKVPRFDNTKYEKLIKCDESEFDEMFIELHTSELPGIKKDGGEIKEKIIEAVRGDDTVDTNLSSLDSKRREMYEFCIHFDNTINMIEKDQNTISNNQTLLNAALSKVSRELDDKAMDIKNKAVSNQNNGSSASPTPATNTVTVNQEHGSAVYSSVYNKYIVEDSTGFKQGKAKESSSSTTAGAKTSGSAVAAGSETIDVNKAATAAGAATASLQTGVNGSDSNNVDNNVDNAKNKLEEYREGSARYFRAGADIMAAKQTLCEAIYKDYMKILRAHVADYGGDATNNGTSQDVNKGIDSSKVYNLVYTNEDKSTDEHKFRYDPSAKFSAVADTNSDKYKKFAKAMLNTAKKILNGKVPTQEHVFYFDQTPCIYTSSGWVDVKVKSSVKVQETKKGNGSSSVEKKAPKTTRKK